MIAVVYTLMLLKDGNKISREALDENRAINIATIERLDTSLAIQREESKTLYGQLASERKKIALQEKDIIESKKPIAQIMLDSVIYTDSLFNVYFYVRNVGTSVMERVLIFSKYKNPQGSALDSGYWSFSSILPGASKIMTFEIRGWQRWDFFCYVDVRFEWPAMAYSGAEWKSYRLFYDQSSKSYRIRVIDGEEHKKFWEH